VYATGEANQQTVAHQSSLPDAPRLISTIRVQAAHVRQARLLPLAHPATISARPGIQRPGAVIAKPQIPNASPVKNSGFRNTFSISLSLRTNLIKPQSLPVNGGRGIVMSERVPCSQYDERQSKCQSGFPRIHPTCWGGPSACHACGAPQSTPMCMHEDPPSHLLRENGLPLGWPAQ